MEKPLKSICCSSLALLIACLLLFACNKNTPAPVSRASLLTGTWNLTAWGEDLNGNGAVDAGETFPPTGGQQKTIVFYNNNTAVISITDAARHSFPDTATWNLTDNDQTLKIVTRAQTTYNRVLTLTAADLATSDTVSQPSPVQELDVYKKQ